MERRIDNWTIRVYDLFKYGDSLAFSWYHPDNNNPNREWLDFNYNGAKWNDRDSNCNRPGPVRNCCEIGPWYSDGPNRMVCMAAQDQIILLTGRRSVVSTVALLVAKQTGFVSLETKS
jgi:hypothetical protein